MKEFLIDLYNNPNFPIYLGAIILVLVIAFFVVFFLGKRDKENFEKTQRMEAINNSAFQETTVPVQMDVNPQVVTNEQQTIDYNNLVSQTPEQAIPMPSYEPQNNIEETYNINNQVVPPVTPEYPTYEQPVYEQPVVQPQPVVAPVYEQPVVAPEPVIQPVETPVYEQPEPVYEQPIYEQPVVEQPVVAPVEEPVFPTLDNSYETIDQRVDTQMENLQNITNSISNELDALEQQQDKYYSMNEGQTDLPVQIEQPVVTPEPPKTNNNVFSSVYMPPKIDESILDDEDENEIELPKLK